MESIRIYNSVLPILCGINEDLQKCNIQYFVESMRIRNSVISYTCGIRDDLQQCNILYFLNFVGMFGVMVVVVLALAPLPGEAWWWCQPWPECLFSVRSATEEISSCLNTDACTKVVCRLLINKLFALTTMWFFTVNPSKQ